MTFCTSKTQRLPRGFFLTFEGPEAAGKTTQLERLAEKLQKTGYDVCRTREPGGTMLGERLRVHIKEENTDEPVSSEAELLMIGAARAQLVNRVILPALNNGKIVLCDRFIDSTTVYQGYARGLDAAFIQHMHEMTTQGRMPDLTVVIDIDVHAGQRRTDARTPQENYAGSDRFENETLDFHEKVREGFLRTARENPGRVCVIDGNQSLTDVHSAILERVEHAIERMAQ